MLRNGGSTPTISGFTGTNAEDSTISTLPKTLPLLVDYAARQYGDRIAIQDGDTHLTYTELNQQRVQAAKAFIAAGVLKGDRCAIWSPNIYEWIIAAIGMQSIGAVLVPLNNRLQGVEAADILARSGAKVLFTYPQVEKGVPLVLLEKHDLPDSFTVASRGIFMLRISGLGRLKEVE